MFNSISLQGILLGLQCALIVWLFSGQADGVDQQQRQQALLAIDKTALNTITISDADDNKVVLKKQDGSWLLPDYHGLAVNKGQLEQILDKLVNADTAWPIAQTTDAAERFHVSASAFKRHLRLQSAGDDVEDIYLGDSPGLRKIYIRNEEQTAIYAIELGLHHAPASAEQWFDKNLLKPGSDIKVVKAADFELLREADDWVMKDLGEQESFNQDKIINLVNYLQFPQVQEVAPQGLVDKVMQAKPVVQYRVSSGDKEIDYELYTVDEKHILKSSLSALYFIVADFVADTIAGIQRDALITSEKGVGDK